MGDLINNFDILKKLGFDSSNQWIFYDDRFQNFFQFFGDNISDRSNILTEHEVLEKDELMQRVEYLNAGERREKLNQLERDNPGLLQNTDAQVTALMENIAIVEQAEQAYAELVEDMRCTKNQLNYGNLDLESSMNVLLNEEKEFLVTCQNKAKQLEELQRENCKLCNEAAKCFRKTQSPPLFVHQLPLDQYLLKCDSFMQYFTLYMKENFKIQDYNELDGSNAETREISSKLEHLAKSIEHYTLTYIKEKAKGKATQSLIDQLDLTQIHVISIGDMARETHELELVSEHHLKSAYDTLLNDLVMHVRQRTQQRMELILYENTKQKLDRALRRRENDQQLTKIISDALSNAELVWIAMQLDLEKLRNRCDNTGQLSASAQACWRRIKTMRQLQEAPTPAAAMCSVFLGSLAAQLSQHLGQSVSSEAKTCIYEYEKFCRLQAYAMQGMLNKKAYSNVLDKLKELNRLENILKPLVYNSPVDAPMFEHVRFLQPIFNAKMNQQRIDKTLRHLRTQFQENITQRMDKEKLWRYSQLLWIWFLTEPRRVLMAIEELKKAAAKVPSMTGVKSLGGIKRK